MHQHLHIKTIDGGKLVVCLATIPAFIRTTLTSNDPRARSASTAALANMLKKGLLVETVKSGEVTLLPDSNYDSEIVDARDSADFGGDGFDLETVLEALTSSRGRHDFDSALRGDRGHRHAGSDLLQQLRGHAFGQAAGIDFEGEVAKATLAGLAEAFENISEAVVKGALSIFHGDKGEEFVNTLRFKSAEGQQVDVEIAVSNGDAHICAGVTDDKLGAIGVVVAAERADGQLTFTAQLTVPAGKPETASAHDDVVVEAEHDRERAIA